MLAHAKTGLQLGLVGVIRGCPNQVVTLLVHVKNGPVVGWGWSRL